MINIDEVYSFNDKQNILLFTKIIYNNFINLINFPYVKHSIKDIQLLLSSENMFGYIVNMNYNKEKKIIAYLFGEISTIPDGRHAYYLSYIYVAPKYRHLKIGSFLIKKIIDKCKYDGIPFIVLTCDCENQQLINFYKKFGFVFDSNLKKNKRHDVMCLYISDLSI